MQCEEASEHLAASAGEADLVERRARRHLQGCLRCQVELANHRKLHRALRALGTEVLATPPGMEAELLEFLAELADEQDEQHEPFRPAHSNRRVAYVGGLAVATATASAIVLVSRSKGRPRLVG